jgi:hypothetical protein
MQWVILDIPTSLRENLPAYMYGGQVYLVTPHLQHRFLKF